VQSFGGNVDIDGRQAIVGASGAAYVFRGTSGSWKEVAVLKPGDPTIADFDVGISGDTALVGFSPSSPGSPSLRSVAYIFERSHGGPDNWGLVTELGTLPQFFGGVAIDGDTALVTGAESAFSCYRQIFGRDIGGQGAWGREPMQRSEPCAGLAVSPSLSGDWAIAISRYGPINFSAGLVVARNQGALASSFDPPGGPNAWGLASDLRLSLPLTPASQRMTSAAISGDTALIAVLHRHVEVLVSDIDGDGIRDGRDPCVRDPLNNVAGGCQRASEQYPVLDELLTQDEVTTETRGKRFIITATFTNISQSEVRNPFFEVTELTSGNVVLNGDASRGGIGSTFSPDVGDGSLSPGESMAVEFVIRLRTREPFEFKVTFRGEL
jgi:hypothetical protein